MTTSKGARPSDASSAAGRPTIASCPPRRGRAGSPFSKRSYLCATLRAMAAPRSAGPCRRIARLVPEHRLRRARRTAGREGVRPVGAPGRPDPERGRDRRQDVDRLHVRVRDAALPLAGPLDEQGDGRDVGEVLRGRQPERPPGPHARAVVRRHDEERVVPDPHRAQALEQRTEQGVGVLHLQQVPLVVEGYGPGVVEPAIPCPADDVGEPRMPAAVRQVDPRLVGQQHVHEVERRAGVAGRRCNRGDVVGGHGGPIPLSMGVPAPEHGIVGREAAPGRGHRREPVREAVRQHGMQVDDGQIAQHRREPDGRPGTVRRAERLGAHAGQRLQHVEAVPRVRAG